MRYVDEYRGEKVALRLFDAIRQAEALARLWPFARGVS